MMMILWAIALSLMNLVWLGLNVFSLPGNWLMVASAAVVAAIMADHDMLSVWTLVAAIVLALVGELVELLASMIGAKRGGAKRGGAWGALLGGIAGAIAGTVIIPVPIIGSLLGACGGACAGAFWFELRGGRTPRESLRAGIGAGVGGFVGKLGKIAIGVVIWVVLTVAAFF